MPRRTSEKILRGCPNLNFSEKDVQDLLRRPHQPYLQETPAPYMGNSDPPWSLLRKN